MAVKLFLRKGSEAVQAGTAIIKLSNVIVAKQDVQLGAGTDTEITIKVSLPQVFLQIYN